MRLAFPNYLPMPLANRLPNEFVIFLMMSREHVFCPFNIILGHVILVNRKLLDMTHRFEMYFCGYVSVFVLPSLSCERFSLENHCLFSLGPRMNTCRADLSSLHSQEHELSVSLTKPL